MRLPSCELLISRASTTSRVAPRFSTSMATSGLSQACISIDAVEGRQVQLRGAGHLEALLFADDLPLRVDADDAAGAERWRRPEAAPSREEMTSYERIDGKRRAAVPGRKSVPGVKTGCSHEVRPRLTPIQRPKASSPPIQVWVTVKSGPRTARSAMAPGRDDSEALEPEGPGGGGRADGGGVDVAEPHDAHQQRERPIHRQHAAREGAVVEVGRVPDGDGLPAQPGPRSERQPGAGRAVGDRHDARRRLGRDARPAPSTDARERRRRRSRPSHRRASSTAPASPGARWLIGVMRLNRCVA